MKPSAEAQGDAIEELKRAISFLSNSLADDYDSLNASDGVTYRYSAYRLPMPTLINSVSSLIVSLKVSSPFHPEGSPAGCFDFTQYDIALSSLDPTSVKASRDSRGVRFYAKAQTTDLKPAITKWDGSHWHGDIPGCKEAESSRVNEVEFSFRDAETRDRAAKALTRAIELAGGQPSAF